MLLSLRTAARTNSLTNRVLLSDRVASRVTSFRRSSTSGRIVMPSEAIRQAASRQSDGNRQREIDIDERRSGGRGRLDQLWDWSRDRVSVRLCDWGRNRKTRLLPAAPTSPEFCASTANWLKSSTNYVLDIGFLRFGVTD